MSVVRAALMLSLGIIISVGIIVLFLHHKDRFTIVPQNKGIFIFDDKSSSVSFCDDKGCTLISVNADDYNRSFREMPFMSQGYMSAPQQYPMGFIPPQAMQHHPSMNPQYPPYAPSPYYSQQNFGPQPGWIGFQNQPAPAQPGQQQQLQQQQPQQQQEQMIPQNNFPQAQEQQPEQMQQEFQQQDQGQFDQGQQAQEEQPQQ